MIGLNVYSTLKRYLFGKTNTSPSMTSGPGVPVAAEALGSIYFRDNPPDASNAVYFRVAGPVWAPLAAATAGTSSISVTTEAALSAFDVTSMPEGTTGWVGHQPSVGADQQCSRWILVALAGGAPALVAHEVIASNLVTHVWMRDLSFAHQRWTQSLTWFLDGTAGDDQNSGQTNVTALKTGRELAMRLARSFVGAGGTVVVTMLSNIADSLDFQGVTGTVSVVAVEPTQAGAGATGFLTAAAAINHALNTFQTITAAGVDFAAFTATKSKVVLTSGTVGAWAFLESGAGGMGVLAQTDPFVTQATPLSTPVVISPAGNEAYKIVSQLTCTQILADGTLGSSNARSLVLAVTGVRPTAQGDGFRGGFVFVNGCDMTGASLTIRGGNTAAMASKIAGATAAPQCFFAARSCLVTGAQIGGSDATMEYSGDTLLSDATIFPNSGRIQFSGAVGWHNTTAPKHAVDNSGQQAMGTIQIALNTAIYGSLAGAASIGFSTGKFTHIDGGGVTPTMTTTGANVAFGTANKTWAQVPFSDYVVGAPGAANNAAWL